MNALKAVLMRKLGPLPVWVYFVTGVLVVAFLLKRRADSQKPSDTGSDVASGGAFPDAQPMNYSSDIFINLPAPTNPNPPPAQTPGGVSTPHPVPLPDTRPAPPPANKAPTTPNRTPASPSPTPRPAQKTKSLTYVVKSGDTLWDIARKYLGSGNNYGKIYQANKTLIESEARRHGFSSSNSGARIWAGEKLVIPVG